MSSFLFMCFQGSPVLGLCAKFVVQFSLKDQLCYHVCEAMTHEVKAQTQVF